MHFSYVLMTSFGKGTANVIALVWSYDGLLKDKFILYVKYYVFWKLVAYPTDFVSSVKRVKPKRTYQKFLIFNHASFFFKI